MTRIIAIEGNIGSGKSSQLELLKQYYHNYHLHHINQEIMFIEEPLNIWNSIVNEHGQTALQCFYDNQQKYAFSFQMLAYISRYKILKDALKKGYDIIFVERSLMTDRHVFCKMLYSAGMINVIEYQIYNMWFDEFLKDIPPIQYIYIVTSPDIALERIKKRDRKGEEFITLDYIIKLNQYHDDWLNFENCICIDGNKDKYTVLNKIIVSLF